MGALTQLKYIKLTKGMTDDLVLNSSKLKRMGATSGSATWLANKSVTSTGMGLRYGSKSTRALSRSTYTNISRSLKKTGIKFARFKKNSPTAVKLLYGGAAIGATAGAVHFWGDDVASWIDKLFSTDITKLVHDLETKGKDGNIIMAGLYIDQDDDTISKEEAKLLMLLDMLPDHIKNFLIASMDNDIMVFCNPDGDIERCAVPIGCDQSSIYEAIKDISFLFSKEIAPFVVEGKFTVGTNTHILLGVHSGETEGKFKYGIVNEAIPYLAHAYAITGGMDGEHKEVIAAKAAGIWKRSWETFRSTAQTSAIEIADMASIYR